MQRKNRIIKVSQNGIDKQELIKKVTQLDIDLTNILSKFYKVLYQN